MCEGEGRRGGRGQGDICWTHYQLASLYESMGRAKIKVSLIVVAVVVVVVLVDFGGYGCSGAGNKK